MQPSKKRLSYSGYLFIAVSCFSMNGCGVVQPVSRAHQKNTAIQSNAWPLRFEKHNVGAACYETYACSVIYNNRHILSEPKDVLQPSSASIGPKYLDFVSGSYLGIKNFPLPAIVSWKSKDGSAHSLAIDVAEIFKEQLVRHNVPQHDIPTDRVAVNDPEIIIEINNRIVNVYMRAMVFLKDTDARRGNFRNDLVLVFSKTV